MSLFKNNVFDSKNAVYEIDNYRVLLRQFKNSRVDSDPTTNFFYSDDKGFLKTRPLQYIIDQIAGDVPIFSLNGLTTSPQTLITTEDGTNFTISSTGSVHSFNLPIASATKTGKLSAADWIRFNAAASPSFGDLTSNSGAINVIGGTGAVNGSGVTLDINAADAADDGILLSSDWNTFMSKLGSASNGLTPTSTLVELGGPLTKHTVIGLGDLSNVFSTKYRLEVRNTTSEDPLMTFFQQAPFDNKIGLFVDMSSGTLQGRVSNTKTNTSVDDQLVSGSPGGGVNPSNSFSWVNGFGGYAGIFSNTSTVLTPYGILARINANVNPTVSNVFHAETESSGTYNSRFIVKGDGKIGLGIYNPASLVNTASSLTNQTDGTVSLNINGFGFEKAGVGYIGAIVNTNNVASSNGLLVRVARNASDAWIARFLYNSNSAGLMLRADGNVGIQTSTPTAALDVAPIYYANKLIAKFGDSQTVKIAYETAHDRIVLSVGTKLNLVDTGGSNPYLHSPDTLRFITSGLTVESNTVGVTSKLYMAAPSGVSAEFGTSNAGPSTLLVSNTNGLYPQTTVFKKATVHVSSEISTSGGSSAVLALHSTTKGFLPPRMTTAERNAIATPENGLIVFDTDLSALFLYAGTWKTILT